MTARYEVKDKIEVFTANYPLAEDVFKRAAEETLPLVSDKEV